MAAQQILVLLVRVQILIGLQILYIIYKFKINLNSNNMYDNYNYPPGADTPDAPWNQCDPDPKEFDCDIAMTIVNTLPVSTSNYYIDSEFGTLETGEVDWNSEYKSQYRGIPALLDELAKYIEGELAGNVSGSRRWKLIEMLEECRGWEIEDIDIEKS